MVNIDNYAYISKLKNINPSEKLFFALLTMGVCLGANSTVISLAILLIMAWITVQKGGIPFKVFLKLMLVPLLFLIIGVLTIAITAADSPVSYIFSVRIFDTYLGVSKTGIVSATRLLFRALGAVSCLYYLSLNTPLIDLLSALKKLKCPILLLELMNLIYRFIFVLMETADTIYLAQNSRLGYSTIKSGYHSLGGLVSTLFVRAYKQSDELYTALEARGYDGGEIKVLEEQFQFGKAGYIKAAVINIFLIIAALALRKYW